MNRVIPEIPPEEQTNESLFGEDPPEPPTLSIPRDSDQAVPIPDRQIEYNAQRSNSRRSRSRSRPNQRSDRSRRSRSYRNRNRSRSQNRRSQESAGNPPYSRERNSSHHRSSSRASQNSKNILFEGFDAKVLKKLQSLQPPRSEIDIKMPFGKSNTSNDVPKMEVLALAQRYAPQRVDLSLEEVDLLRRNRLQAIDSYYNQKYANLLDQSDDPFSLVGYKQPKKEQFGKNCYSDLTVGASDQS